MGPTPSMVTGTTATVEAPERITVIGTRWLPGAERAQIKVLEEFLPPEIDPEEIRVAVRAAIAGGAKDIGKVMGQVMPRFKGRFDGKALQQIAREVLGL